MGVGDVGCSECWVGWLKVDVALVSKRDVGFFDGTPKCAVAGAARVQADCAE